MKWPKIPGLSFVGQKFLLKRRTFEDDENPRKYKIEFFGDLPENTVKLVYDQLFKKKTGLDFESGLKDGESLDIPIAFFNQKAGILTWKETVLRQLDKHFNEVSQKLGWIFITKQFKLMRIMRKGSTYSIYIEVKGEKAEKK